MSELSFLLELLLNHKLPKTTQLVIKDRIATVEETKQAPALSRKGLSGPIELTMEQVAAKPLPLAESRIVGGEVSTGNNSKGPRKF